MNIIESLQLNIIENCGWYENELLKEFNVLSQSNSNVDRWCEIITEFLYLDSFNEDIFFEMAGFKKEKSGLPFNIWLDDMGIMRNNTHKKPRIKVQDPDDPKNFISYLIDRNNPKILAGKFKKKQNDIDIISFIKNTYDDLMKLWNQEIDSTDFINKHKKC